MNNDKEKGNGEKGSEVTTEERKEKEIELAPKKDEDAYVNKENMNMNTNTNTNTNIKVKEEEEEESVRKEETIKEYKEFDTLKLEWVFGFNKDIPGGAHNLSDERRKRLFYTAGHTAVLYDVDSREQLLLRGHRNTISCSCSSKDKQWVATADIGHDSMIIVWDANTGTPVRTIFNPNPSGITAIDINDDAMVLVTLSNATSVSSPTPTNVTAVSSTTTSPASSPISENTKSSSNSNSNETNEQGGQQRLDLWEWTSEQETPVLSAVVPSKDIQTCVRFKSNQLNEGPFEIVTNGEKKVIFWTANTTSGTLKYYTPAISSKDFRHSVANFTHSLFVPGSTVAVSCTVDGEVLLWDSIIGSNGKLSEKKAQKVLKLHDAGISYLTHTEKYIVTGDELGCVRFFDFQFRLVAWFEDLESSPITSISFSNTHLNPYDISALNAVDFLIATQNGVIMWAKPSLWEELAKERRRGQVLLRHQDGDVKGIDAHPSEPIFATAGYSGTVHLWNYETKELLASRKFEKLMAHTISFHHSGKQLVVGFTNGTIRILSAENGLKDHPKGIFRNSRDCITFAVFSKTKHFLAVADADRCISLYKGEEDDLGDLSWQYQAKYRSHTKPVSGLMFGESIDTGEPRLLSLGEDRCLVEYDLAQSSVATGLVIQNITEVEQVAIPTSMIWHPRLNKEDFFLIANNYYKFKLFNSNTKMCRRTLLGPTYGGPLNRMIALPNTQDSYFAYSTHAKVIGLGKFPLDGNPNKAIGLIAHSGEISSMVVSHDGKYLLTAGGSDYTVNFWRIDFDAFEAICKRGGEGIQPFVDLIEGGLMDEFGKDMEDYFYYAQIKCQGEDSVKPRIIGSKVPVQQVPNIMRALGFYPTEQEVEDMINEMRFSKLIETGQSVEEIDFDTLVKIYVNHRPVFAITKKDIKEAFQVLRAGENGEIELDQLLLNVQYKGEAMTDNEIRECFDALLGEDAEEKLKEKITAEEFAEEILGFDDYKQ